MVINFGGRNNDAASNNTAATTSATKKNKSKNKTTTRAKTTRANNTKKKRKQSSKTTVSSSLSSSTSTSTTTISHHHLPRQLRLLILFIAIISFVSIWKSTTTDFTSSSNQIYHQQTKEEHMLLPTTTTTTKLSTNNLTSEGIQILNSNKKSIIGEESSTNNDNVVKTDTTTNTTTNMIVTAEGITPINNNNIQQTHQQQQQQQQYQSATTYTLKPPFQIIQVGNSRSGTTFQYNLLDAIISLKTPSHLPVPSDKNRGFVSGWSNDAFRIRIQHKTPFLLKFHASKQIFKDLQKETNDNYTRWLLLNSTTTTTTTTQQQQKQQQSEESESESEEFHFGVFSSGQIGSSYSLYTQNFDSLINCSLCEINNYRQYFGLTTDDIITIKNHMHIYGIIRQCCGLQMSKYEILRLNGCNITQYKYDNPRYPNCEYYNLSNIEKQMVESPIPYKSNSPRWNWKKPGHCLYYRNKVQSEKLQFMGKPFEGCPNGTNPDPP